MNRHLIALGILILVFAGKGHTEGLSAPKCAAIFAQENIKTVSKQHVLDQRDWNTRYYGPQDKPGVYPGAYVDLKFDYWQVDQNDSRLKIFGDISELIDQNGKVTLIGDMHFETFRQSWMIQKSSRILESIFGAKTGELTGHRHSSVRSATIELPENHNVWVKLDGSYLDTYRVDKTLSVQDILKSQESNQLLKSSPLFLQELGAVLVKSDQGESVPMISRQNPLSTVVNLQEGDRLVTLHSLAANLNDYQPQSDYGGLARNENPQRSWFKKADHQQTVKDVIAAIADVVVTSVFDFGVHLAPHGQNMEFLISKEGSIKRYWQKDLQEAKIDVVLAKHLGLVAKDTKHLEKFDADVAEAKIKKWYVDYLRVDQQSIMSSGEKFNEMIKEALIKRFKIWVKANREKYQIEKLKENLNRLSETPMEPGQVVLELRKLILDKSHP